MKLLTSLTITVVVSPKTKGSTTGVPLFRSANSDEVKGLRNQAAQLKEALAETVLENRLLKKSMFGAGGEDI